MKYVAILQYIADVERVQSVRPRHREHLASLKAAGSLVMAGPFGDGSGALIVYEAESDAAAAALLRADPFSVEGIVSSYTLRAWSQVF